MCVSGPSSRTSTCDASQKIWTEERRTRRSASEQQGSALTITRPFATSERGSLESCPVASHTMDPRLRPRIRPKPSALSFNLSAACASLLQHLPTSIPTSAYPASSLRIVQQCATGQGPSGSASKAQVLDALSDLMLVEDLTVLVAVYCRPLVLDLTARLLPVSEQTWHESRVKQSFHALCRLLPAMPELCP